VKTCNGLLSSNSKVCSGKGTCVDDEICECDEGFVGDYCDYEVCDLTNEHTAICKVGAGECSAEGTECECYNGNVGHQCHLFQCGSRNSTDPEQCLGRGVCNGPEKCECFEGYTGVECEYALCNGISAENTSFVCNGHGSCLNTDYCLCDSGYTGQFCDNLMCFDVPSDDEKVCHGHGTCVDFDTCDCQPGYGGPDCNEMKCFGIPSDNPHVCSGNGICFDIDNCLCYPLYEGEQCEFPTCFGLYGNGSCSGHGECVAPNTCICDEHYGDVDCNLTSCYGVPSDNANVCSGNGKCSEYQQCDCEDGWIGDKCEQMVCGKYRPESEHVCSGRGNCTGPDICTCQDGYTGLDCEYVQCFTYSTHNKKHVCHGHGTCLTPNNCTCDDGWVGEQCATFGCNGISHNDTEVCNSRGLCIAPNNCSCDDSWSGDNCQYATCFGIRGDDEKVCTWQNGECVEPDVCVCANEFIYGERCNYTECNGLGDCNTHGLCIGTALCKCRSGWGAADCNTFNCNGLSGCSGHGSCIGPNKCKCQSGYGNFDCGQAICWDLIGNNTNVCSKHGNCTGPDTCTCKSGYGGKACEIPVCYGINGNVGTVCSGRGDCLSPNKCKCQTGFVSLQCEYPICYGIWSNDTTNACSGNGACNQPDQCDCNPGYTGNKCQYPVCDKISAALTTKACTGRGPCLGPDNCKCNTGYLGDFCEVSVCHGTMSNATFTVCSGHGDCIDTNTCKCDLGWIGNNCQTATCNFIASTNTVTPPCSGNGLCVAAEQCVCDDGFGGFYCQHPTCYGISAGDPFVCSGRGTCTSHNNCTCVDGFLGDQCELVEDEVAVCGGLSALSMDVCSSRGECIKGGNGTSDSYCSCDSGYEGDLCQYPVCNGVSAEEATLVCNGYGSCVAPNTCECATGYSGSNCQIYKCYGIVSTNSSVCTGKGACVAPNTCVCNTPGYFEDCKVTTCSGIRSDTKGVCSGNGACTAPNTCTCNAGAFGLTCEQLTCFGKLAADVAVCNGHGTCSGPNKCTCKSGYTSTNCTIPACSGLWATDPKVCSGRGKCIDLNTCDCVQDDVHGYFAGTNCAKCRIDYKVYPYCNQTLCDDTKTCNANGFCSEDGLSCNCKNSTFDGFFKGKFCDTCQENYYGKKCKTFCEPSITCNSVGTCNTADGSCTCFSSQEKGYFRGASCDRCQAFAFGPECRTQVPGTFKFSNTADSVSGDFLSPRTAISCEELLHPEDFATLGDGARCGYFGTSGKFSIYFGASPTAAPNNRLRFNVEFTDPTELALWKVTTLQAPSKAIVPVAQVTAKASIGICDGITVDASSSSSPEGRSVAFTWAATAGADLESLNKFLTVQSTPYVNIPGQLLTPGSSYTITVTVKNFMGKTATAQVSFDKANDAVAIANIAGPATQQTYKGNFFRLDALGVIGECFYEDESLIFTWRQTNGPTVTLTPDANALLFPANTFPVAQSTYSFEVEVRPVANPVLFTTAAVSVYVQPSALQAILSGGSKRIEFTDEDFTVDASESFDPDDSEENETFKWFCYNSVTGGLCPQEILSQLASGPKSITVAAHSLPASNYQFIVNYVKGSRIATAKQTFMVSTPSNYRPKLSFFVSPDPVVSAQGFGDSDIVFVVQVDGLEETVEYEYSWLINEIDVDEEDDGITAVTEDTLKIAKDSLLPGVIYTVKYLIELDDGETAYVSKAFNINIPPQAGVIDVSPKRGIALKTQFTFVANQFKSSTSTNLKYQWTLSDKESGSIISTTSPAKENLLILDGLPAGTGTKNELLISVKVFDDIFDSITIEQSITVAPPEFDSEADKNQALSDTAGALGDLTGFAQQSQLSITSDKISKTMGGSAKRSIKDEAARQAITSVLITGMEQGHNAINPQTPLDAGYVQRIGNNVNNVVQTGSMSTNTQNKTLNLIDSVVDSVLRNDVVLTSELGGPLLESVSSIVSSNPSYSAKGAALLDKILAAMSSSLSVNSVKEIKQAGATLFTARYLVSGFQKVRVTISPVQGQSKFLLPSTLSFSQGVATKLKNANLVTIDVAAKLYDSTYNTHLFPDTSTSVWASLFLDIELRDTSGKVVPVSNLLDTGVSLTVPSLLDFNAKPLRDPKDLTTSGWYPACRYLNTVSGSWVVDSTCSVTNFTATAVTCSCSHLTAFGVTYDYKKGVPIGGSTSNTGDLSGDDSDSHKSGISAGAIVGIVVGVLGGVAVVATVAVAVTAIIVFFVVKKKKNAAIGQVPLHEEEEVEMRNM
jgi:hypothetical protein